MINRSIFGIVPPKLTYDTIDDEPLKPVTVIPKEKVTLYLEEPLDKTISPLVQTGNPVKAGEKLQLYPDSREYAISPVSGIIDSVGPFIGFMEKQMTSVVIKAEPLSGEQEIDASFEDKVKDQNLETVSDFLRKIPGNPDFSSLSRSDEPVKTIVILGMDTDLMTITNQYVIKNDIASIKDGVDILRKIASGRNVNIIIAVPDNLVQTAGGAGVTVKTVSNFFPHANPEMVAFSFVGTEAPGQKDSVAFFTAEAVSNIGKAFKRGKIPVEKVITFVGKDGSKKLVSAPIGTHVKDILEKLSATVKDGDRIVLGGPMTGVSIYSIEQPVEPDTDTIILQDQGQIIPSEDLACINCGQCVRVCPTDVPVNELIRYLDAGEYEQAAERADLEACIECGYCTYVCESRIPIFQHIRLAKHALKRMKAVEENNA